MIPITWRNIDSPSFVEASNILSSAGRSINSGIEGLNQAIQKRSDNESDNWAVGKKNNTRDFLGVIAKAKSLEELDALEKSGQLTTMREAAGKQFDDVAAANATVNQRNALRQQILATNTFNNQSRDASTAAAREKYAIAIANGDTAGAQKIASENDLGANEAEIITKGVASARAAELAPLAHSNTLEGLKDTATAIDTNRQTVALDRAAATAVQTHRQRQDTIGQTLALIGKDLNLPLDTQGRVRMDLLTKDQYTGLETAVNAQLPKDKKVPNIFKMYENGDTEAADTFISGLAGKFDPAIVEKNRETLRQKFNSDTGQTLVGRDAQNVARETAKQEVIDNENRTINTHAPGSKTAMANYEILSKEIPALIDTTTGFGTNEDVQALQNFLNRVSTEGVDIGGGKKVVPSANDLRAAIRGAEGGWFRDQTRASNAEDLLLKAIRNKGAIQRNKESEEITIRDRGREVKRILGK